MKYLSLFSGIGGFELGIQQAYEDNKFRQFQQKCKIQSNENNLQYEGNKSNVMFGDGNGRWNNPICIGYSEIDKYAIQIYEKHFGKTFYYCSYCRKQAQTERELFTEREGDSREVGSCCVNSGVPAPILFHKAHKNYGDITKINPKELPDFDLIVGGFPCQSFSIAGKRGGFNDTRGTLFFEIARIIREKQPRFLLLENVKGLLSHDKGATFYTIISTLDELGYDLQWQVLNSKNFGVPQNRERVFIIGHLRGTSRPEVFPFGENDKGSNQEQLSRPETTTETRDMQHIKDWWRPEMCIRRLTPTECERLQGFPDGWTEYGVDSNGETIISDTQRYRSLGNAVTTNVIKEVIHKLST